MRGVCYTEPMINDDTITPYEDIIREKQRRKSHKEKRMNDDRNAQNKRIKSPIKKKTRTKTIKVPMLDYDNDS